MQLGQPHQLLPTGKKVGLDVEVGQYIENIVEYIADIDMPVSVSYRHFRYRFFSIYRYRIGA